LTDFKEIVAGAAREFSKRVEQYAGPEIRNKVIQDGGNLPDIFDPVKGALDYKEAIDRLDKLVDKTACGKILMGCGHTCQSLYDRTAAEVKTVRRQYATEEEFMANLRPFNASFRFERKGKDLVQHFSPRKFASRKRCDCPLIGGLPEGVYASPKVCQCSRGFTQQRWEIILGRPVEVEVVSSPIINGSEDCTFIIHL
jgi:hypothetical protein